MVPTAGRRQGTSYIAVSDGYFATLQIRLLKGLVFGPRGRALGPDESGNRDSAPRPSAADLFGGTAGNIMDIVNSGDRTITPDRTFLLRIYGGLRDAGNAIAAY